MSEVTPFVEDLKATRRFFNTSTSVLTEEHADFTPVPGMFTAAQQIAHTAQCVEWFIDGAFSPTGFSHDFEGMEAEVRKVTTMAEARDWFSRAMDAAIAKIAACSMAELLVPLPEGPIMGGMPRLAVVSGIADHTAHHRGSLVVYARLAGLVPTMAYA